MPSVVVIEFDAVRSIKSEYKSKVINLEKKLPVSVTINVSKELQQLMKADPLYLSKIVEAASEEYKRFISVVVEELKTAEKKFVNAADVDKKNIILKNLRGYMQAQAKALDKDAVKACKGAHDLHMKTKAEYYKYTNFKIGCKAKIGVDAVNIAVGSVGVASAVSTGGVSAIFGIYKLFKAIVSIVREVYKLNRAASKERDKVEKFLNNASKIYKDGKKKTSTGAKEFAKTFLNTVTGIKFTKTITDAVATNKIYRAKLLGLDKKSHELAVKLNQALYKSDEATKELKKSKGKAAAKADKHLKSIEKSVSKLINGIINMQEGTKKALQWQKSAEAELKTIAGGKPGWSKVMEKGLKVVDIVAYCSIADWGEKTAQAGLTAARLALTEIDKDQASKLEMSA